MITPSSDSMYWFSRWPYCRSLCSADSSCKGTRQEGKKESKLIMGFCLWGPVTLAISHTHQVSAARQSRSIKLKFRAIQRTQNLRCAKNLTPGARIIAYAVVEVCMSVEWGRKISRDHAKPMIDIDHPCSCQVSTPGLDCVAPFPMYCMHTLRHQCISYQPYLIFGLLFQLCS